MNQTPPPLPNVRLYGEVGVPMLKAFLDQLAVVESEGKAVVLELTTPGGDADIGRRIADDIRLFRKRTGQGATFLGKTAIFSAGATIMSGFLAADRWLTHDAVVMIHGRKLSKCPTFDGPLRDERATVLALLAEIDTGVQVEAADFRRLIEGSDITEDEIQTKARVNWYLGAEEALERGLVAGAV